jgi:hypothetical protein
MKVLNVGERSWSLHTPLDVEMGGGRDVEGDGGRHRSRNEKYGAVGQREVGDDGGLKK